MEIGLKIYGNLEEEIKKVRELGLSCCQIVVGGVEKYSDEYVEGILSVCEKYNVRISAVWCGLSGPCVWNFTDGPSTIGLVPEAYRFKRMDELINGADFAKRLGIKNVITHCGFIPENPSTEEFVSFVNCIRVIAEQYKAMDMNFLFETGQETPTTLRRVIDSVGTGNLGVNLDTANLILYGKANPVDALDTVGEFVMDTHIKDGFYPTDGANLGREVKVGEGKANIPVFIAKLKELGYDGPLTIEREIEGEQQIKDIKETIEYLKALI